MEKELLLSDELYSQPSKGIEERAEFGRRDFVKGVAVAGAALALMPKNVFAEPAEAGIWKDRVTGFVSRVFERDYARAERINAVIRSSRIDWATATSVFHWSYAAPLVFLSAVDAQTVICSHEFEVRRYPLYSLTAQIQSFSDLNAYEIRRVTNEREIALLGCVVAPTGYRTPVDESRDHADYQNTLRSYRLDPNQFRPLNKRVYTGTNNRSRYGYEVQHNTDVGRGGKPLRDVLLSDRDW